METTERGKEAIKERKRATDIRGEKDHIMDVGVHTLSNQKVLLRKTALGICEQTQSELK